VLVFGQDCWCFRVGLLPRMQLGCTCHTRLLVGLKPALMHARSNCMRCCSPSFLRCRHGFCRNAEGQLDLPAERRLLGRIASMGEHVARVSPPCHCTVRVFRQKFARENAYGSHACSLEAILHACGQWHSSRVLTTSYRCHHDFVSKR
jgi:hypothetical protein